MKVAIKHWQDARVIFEAEIPDDTEEQFRVKLALELAVRRHVRLDGARLDGARLNGASFDGARLNGATDINWTPIRDDYWAVLSSAPAEVRALRAAIVEGRIDGSTYEGECACLVGTIANVREVNYQQLGILQPNSYRAAERFFLGIKKGDTPATNKQSALALEWTDQWLAAMESAFGAKQAGV